jgi:hypothetical protein
VLRFLDNLDSIPFGIVNLKIVRSLTILLDGSNYDSTRRQHFLSFCRFSL